MKKSRKAVSVAAALILTLVSAVSVPAEDRQGPSGWEVDFTGKKMTSNFTSADMTNEANAMQPGDSVEFTITLKNSYDGQADWYMRNEVLESLEDAGDASGGAYDYLLTYTDAKGDTSTLYSSAKFGGDGRIGGVGLHGATSSLDDYFYLDRLGKSDSGVVKLKVALDGETLVNDYQNTLARLQMDFATELANNANGGGNGNGNNGNGSGNGSNRGGSGVRPVKTGDDTDIVRYIVMMFASGAVLLIGGLLLLRRNQEEEEVETVEVTGQREG